MPHLPALLAGAAFLLGAPLAAQVGLGSTPRPVTLSATRLSSVAVTVAGTAASSRTGSPTVRSDRVGALALTTTWNVDPTEPVAITLLAFMDGPDTSLHATLAGVSQDEPAVRVPSGWSRTYPAFARATQLGLGGRAISLFAQPIALLVARGGRTDDVQVGTTGTLTLVAITQ